MSPIIINSTVNNNLSKTKMTPAPTVEDTAEENTEKSREERRATGRTIAIVIFVILMCTAIYHVIQKKTTVLTGILVPALILFTYLFFVIHVSSREKKKRQQLEASTDLELSKTENHKKISTTSSPSLTSMSPSSSGVSMSSRNNLMPKVSSCSKISTDPKASAKKLKPFKKAQSQSQLRSNQSTSCAVEHEKKKLKKSRSFDKNNCLLDLSNASTIESKKSKTKH